MDAWLAALAVAVAYAILAAVIGVRARSQLRRMEAPVDTVRRHWDEQRDWFQDRVLGESAPRGDAE